jgi:hypothetical protein
MTGQVVLHLLGECGMGELDLSVALPTFLASSVVKYNWSGLSF